MNKKYLMFGIPLFAIVLVMAALIVHYNVFNQEINVNQPIEVTGDTTQSINCNAGDFCDGSNIYISNDGNNPIKVSIDSLGEIDTEYYSNLELTKKQVDFNLPVWNVLDDKVQVRYKVIGNSFNAEVLTPKPDYELIYYKDNSDRFNSPAEPIKISEISGNLPYEDDKNTDEYNYCSTGEYLTCNGAKIWYVPTTAINLDNTLDWSRASEFYFESELIQFNSNEIITYPSNTLTIIPVYNPDIALEEGIYFVTTEVNPIA